MCDFVLANIVRINSTKAVKKIGYDQTGNIIREQTQNNAIGSTAAWTRTDYTYNNRNMLTMTESYNGSTVASRVQYAYDATGNMLAMASGQSTILSGSWHTGTPSNSLAYSLTKYTYDRFNNMLTVRDALNQVETYTYYSGGAGNVQTKTDRNGWVTTYTYDGLGRPITQNVTTGNASRNVSQSWTYTLTGQVRTESNDGFTSTYTYDALSRLTQASETVNNVVKTYGYDIGGNRISMVLRTGGASGTIRQRLYYTYDNLSRLSTVRENATSATTGTLIATYAYDANGNRSTLSSNNGVTTTYTYNQANLVKTLVNARSGQTLSSYSYAYRLDGNQTSKTDNTGKVTSYVYDGLGRLTSESEPGSSISYQYDSRGNRTQMTNNGIVTAYTYDKNNRLTSTTETAGSTVTTVRYTYDANGNQLSQMTETTGNAAGAPESASIGGTGWEFNSYNGLNQLVKAEKAGVEAVYAYKADGMRHSKKVNGAETAHVWDGANIAVDIAGSSVVSYVRGIGLLKAGTVYYAYNGHGDAVQLTNGSGVVTKTYNYDAFGVERNPAASDTNAFRYAGEYYDKETETYYLRARYYQPKLGRFTQEDRYWHAGNMIYGDNPQDPLGLNIYTPDIRAIMQSSNLYVYCGSNPIMYKDASGQFWDIILDIGGIIWGVYDLVTDPSWENAGYLLLDIGSAFVPFVPAAGTGIKIVSKADDVVDVAKALNKVDNAVDISKLLKAGNQLDKGGELTKVGRSLEKHGSRPGSIYPSATGNVANKNALGNQVLESILNNPNATIVNRHHAMLGDILEIKIPGGMGARFSADMKTFIGFLE